MGLMSEEEIKKFIENYPIDEKRRGYAASDLSRISFESFANGDEQPLFSSGELRFTGSGVTSNAVDLMTIGKFIVSFQTLANKFVAKKFEEQRITKSVESAAKMSLAASPIPGSVILKVQSAQASNEYGQPVLSGIETDLDTTFMQLMEIIKSAQVVEPELDSLSHLLEGFGASACASIRRVTGLLKDNEIDLEVTWRMPLEETKWAYLAVRDSTLIHDLVKRRNLDEEVVQLQGVVESASRTKKIPLSITTSSGEFVDLYADREVHIDVTGIAIGVSVIISARKTETGIGTEIDSRHYTLLAVEQR